jgi:hypothetical protein
MTRNPLDMWAPDEPAAQRSDDLRWMLERCHQMNSMPSTERMERWYFISPASNGRPAEIVRADGLKAREMRARAKGDYQDPWKPEPGETEWIGRATAEYLRRHPGGGLTPAEHHDHYQATMARWAQEKPWRRPEGAEAA